MTRTTVATANVNQHLDRNRAGVAIDAVLDLEPDLVGLQEWYPTRRSVLRDRGDRGYRWWSPLVGGCAVGVRTTRFELLTHRQRLLSPPGRADRGDRAFGLEPPRLATVAVLRDREVDQTVSVVVFHLVSGVQSHDRYRDDRPTLVARHQRESAALRGTVAHQIDRGHAVYALGDSNLHGFALPGLVSAWQGREHEPGTLGPRRHVDDVFALCPARSVRLVETPSDHRAVVVVHGA